MFIKLMAFEWDKADVTRPVYVRVEDIKRVAKADENEQRRHPGAKAAVLYDDDVCHVVADSCESIMERIALAQKDEGR